MLDKDETIKFIRQAKCGDLNAKEILLENNTSLLKSIVRRFNNKGIDYEDLYQLACVGFLKAISNFNEEFEVRFSTYAVPMIAGEIKRFMRDDGSIKVSRAIKILAHKINRFIQEYANKNNKSPDIEEIANAFNVDCGDVVVALDSVRMPISLFETSNDDKDNTTELIDKIPSNDNQEQLIDKLLLKNIIKDLPERDKKIIILRYYRDMTQSEIAKMLGISQVQVSRLENKIIEKIKIKL
jgi:RNA polymerase sporulation-specific sigma factor